MAEEIKTIYTDGVGKIHFYGNMIRLDLMDFVPNENAEEPGDADGKKSDLSGRITHRLVMNPHAFLATYESFVNMIDKLTKAGVLSPVNNNTEEQLPPENTANENINAAGSTVVEDVN